MARISDRDIDSIRAKADIVDVIGRYLQVQRKGKSYVALCPFHDDHSPSMSISPDRQIFKCFVCGAGGNVFGFVQRYENISFPEAVSRVAGLIGYPLSIEPETERKPEDPHKEALHKVLEESIRYAMYAMNTGDAALEKQYLEDRGLDQRIREMFQIGYNPRGNALYQFLKAKGYSDQEMVDANVVRTGQSGIQDVFSGRITFPIHDRNGRPIGFSARTIDPENQSKYINTTDTDVFHKSDIVYNYHRARESARREGCIYVTEGVTDVIAFARAGITNCVCTLGTSCTEHQISQLKTLARKVVFCYDGDNAGQSATYRAGQMAKKAGCDIAVIANDTGKDPDEIVREQGAEGLKKLVSRQLTWIEFVMRWWQKQTDFDNYTSRKEFVQRVQSEIDTLEDEFDKRHFTEELSRLSGFRLEYQPKTPKYTGTPKNLSAAVKTPDGFEEAEDIILAMMMANVQASDRFVEKLGYLTDKIKHAASMMIVDAYRTRGTAEPSILIDGTADEEIRQLFIRLSDHWAYSIPYEEKIFDGAVRKVMIRAKTVQANAFRQALKNPLSAENAEVLLDQYQECLKELRRYIDDDNQEEQ